MSRRSALGALAVAGLGAVAAPAVASADRRAGGVVDLTHTLSPTFPVWPGNEPFAMKQVSSVERDRFYVNELRYWEHTGTHIDAPAHKIAGGATVETIPVDDLVVPLVVVDIEAKAKVNDDAALTVADVTDWEGVHGRIPDRAFVAMYSGWERRLIDPATFVNRDLLGIAHAPGFAPDAVDYLVQQRNIVGIGVDTLSLDVSSSFTYGAHVAALGAGRFGVEALANLGAVPPAGATVVIGAPKHVGGSGGPCRVLALT